MSLAFPALKNCNPVKYPLGRSVTFNTKVARFLDDTEQRFAKRYRQDYFAITLAGLDAADRDKVDVFFENCRGPIAPFLITIPEKDDQVSRSVDYDNVYFTGDTLTWTESDLPERWTITFQARQAAWDMVTPTGAPGGFPRFTDVNGKPRFFQRPISMSAHMHSVMADHPDTGIRWGSALRNTPRGPRQRVALHSWNFKVQVPLSEIWHLEDHFLKCRGRLVSFGFDAPDGFRYDKCRWGQDTLEIVYAAPGEVTADVTIEEIP